MEKITQDGKTAVLYTTSFGGGWSTNALPEHQEALCMDARIVGPFLEGDTQRALSAAEELCSESRPLAGAADGLKVRWVPKGKKFEIESYDGCESVHVIGERKYHTA